METSLNGKALVFGPNDCGFESHVSNIIPYNPPSYLSNHLNIILTKQLASVTLRYSNLILNLVRILYQLGCIYNYVITMTKRKKLHLSTLFYKNKPYFFNIHNISTNSKQYFISYNSLKLLTKFLGSAIIVLSTSQGFLNHTEAVFKKIGGLVIYVII